jgi:hypothetical protein
MVHDKSWNTIAEDDGAYFLFRYGKYRLGLVEAKTGPNKSNEALKQLNDSIDKCSLHKYKVRNRTRSLSKGRGYSILELK